MITPTRISHLIRPEDLNHHGTLFAGRMAEWMVEACFIAAARLVGRPQDIVCARVHDLTMSRPANRGDIIEITTRVVLVGASSITVAGDVVVNEETTPVVQAMATFVTVDADTRPYAHGIALDPGYLQANQALHDRARALRSRR